MIAKIEVGLGELIDKITILEIKKNKIKDVVKLANVKTEHCFLISALDSLKIDEQKLLDLKNDLLEINLKLWNVEDHIRCLETDQDFGEKFIELARSVYKLNDNRSQIKRKINEDFGSKIIEEKSYHS
jgi:hypothetical protein